jgi:hypothetical protein
MGNGRMRSFLLVTKNRYDRLLSAHHNQRELHKQRLSETEERLNQMMDRNARLNADLAHAQDTVIQRTKDVEILTQLIQDDDVRKRGVEIANSEIIIWRVGEDGENEPPSVRNTIAGFWRQYVGIRPQDVSGLLPGMIGISVMTRPNATPSDVLSISSTSSDAEQPRVDETSIDRIPVVFHEMPGMWDRSDVTGGEIEYPGDVRHVFVDSPDTLGCMSCGNAYSHECHIV